MGYFQRIGRRESRRGIATHKMPTKMPVLCCPDGSVSKVIQNENARVICGDTSNTSFSMKINSAELPENEKLALAKIQCSQQMNLVDPALYETIEGGSKSPAKIFEIAHREGGRNFRLFYNPSHGSSSPFLYLSFVARRCF